jgi:hypothetical protein
MENPELSVLFKIPDQIQSQKRAQSEPAKEEPDADIQRIPKIHKEL